VNIKINKLLNSIEKELIMLKKERTIWTDSEYETICLTWGVVLDMIDNLFDVDISKYRNIL
jgi:hypothetical protein